MAKTKPWGYLQYRNALLGVEGLPGLRSVATGFASQDGFNLSDFASWSTSKKNSIKRMYDKLSRIYAQPREIVRTSRPDHLVALQKQFHNGDKDKRFKVGFIPADTVPQLPGAKKRKRRVTFTKRGVQIERGGIKRPYYEFDKPALAKNPDAEIKRALSFLPEGAQFFIQTGEFHSLNAWGEQGLVKTLKQWMHKYNGVDRIPPGSRNYGDNPDAHHWERWLNGVVAISAPSREEVVQQVRAIQQGLREYKRLHKLRRDKQAGIKRRKR